MGVLSSGVAPLAPPQVATKAVGVLAVESGSGRGARLREGCLRMETATSRPSISRAFPWSSRVLGKNFDSPANGSTVS